MSDSQEITSLARSVAQKALMHALPEKTIEMLVKDAYNRMPESDKKRLAPRVRLKGLRDRRFRSDLAYEIYAQSVDMVRSNRI